MIRFVVALGCEARPLIDRFDLVRERGAGASRFFTGEDVALMISGIGRERSQAAVEMLATRTGGGGAWINVGLAGHRQAALGSAWLASQVREAATGEVQSLPAVGYSGLPRVPVVTVDSPETSYPEDALYDMEAAAFVSAARLHAPPEMVHVLKVVSDNRHQSVEALTAALGDSLIRRRLPEIAALAETLRRELARLR